MYLDKYEKDKPLSFDFTEYPVAKFAKENNLLEIMRVLEEINKISLKYN